MKVSSSFDSFLSYFGGLITSSNITSPKVIFLIENYLWHHFVENMTESQKLPMAFFFTFLTLVVEVKDFRRIDPIWLSAKWSFSTFGEVKFDVLSLSHILKTEKQPHPFLPILACFSEKKYEENKQLSNVARLFKNKASWGILVLKFARGIKQD